MVASLDVQRPIDLNLPQAPITQNKEMYDQLFDVYNALRALKDGVEEKQDKGDKGEKGEKGEKGDKGEDGSGNGQGMVPYFISSTEPFLVPLYKQALFAVTIDNEGILDVEGILVEVS